MIEEDSEFRVQEPGLSVFIVAVILGSGVSFVLATYLLGLSPLWVALPVGGIFSVFGLFMGENIVEAVILSFVCALVVFFLLQIIPSIKIIRSAIVPIAAGFCVGKIVYGVWTEIT
jgi:hypothetical protein